jgi:aminopeptidase
MNQEILKKYAKLIISKGINIQKDQIIVLSAPVEEYKFARIVIETAYEYGAKDVIMNWTDEIASKLWYKNVSDGVLEYFPNWKKEFYLTYVNQNAAFIHICAEDPELLKDIDPEKITKSQKPAMLALQEYMQAIMCHKNTWCVVSVPSEAWAAKVFPNLSVDEAIQKLWQAIIETTRLNAEDPIVAWNNHIIELHKKADFLNRCDFQYLTYKNSIGTNFTIELPENHIWACGGEYTPNGIEFVANIPTEEIFTMPKKSGMNGKVVSSMPLNHNGTLIDKFWLQFEQGRIIDYGAEQGYKTLKSLIDTDEGSHYLGEVALVPYNSPISNLNILFYNTLFDENASCHLAIGKAYPTNIKNGSNLTTEQLLELDVNDSLTHVDFMIGTADLEIKGMTRDGKEIIIFENGNFKGED